MRLSVFRFLLMCCWFVIVGCQTVPLPKRYSNYSEGQWKAKVLLKNKRTGESNVVDLKLYAIKDKALRMDITATLGVNVASFLMKEQNVKYVLYQSKEYFEGKRRPQVMKPLIQIALSPRVLYSVAFDTPIEMKGWTCVKNEKGHLKMCRSLKSRVQLKWSDEVAGRKKIRIQRDHLELEVLFTRFQNEIVKKNQVFQLKIPSSFRRKG